MVCNEKLLVGTAAPRDTERERGAVGLSPANGAERGIDKCHAPRVCAAAIAYGSGFRPIGFEVSELPVLDLDTEGDPKGSALKGSAPKGPSILRVAIAYSLCTPLACNSLESVKTVKADMCMAYGGGNMPIKRAFLFAYLHSVQMQKKETAFLDFLHFFMKKI